MLKDSADIYLSLFVKKKKEVEYTETHTNKVLFSHFGKASLIGSIAWIRKTG